MYLLHNVQLINTSAHNQIQMTSVIKHY